ncbi:SusD/RagB family nutrient-binding outer membrane lipoprotein [Flavobacterium qiangtangense]|uniref:SusD/RagB family nutrient-binding outer membrane lipoprotein n=1 Tax=Flavobacterium qiangtangense TaxID=1442595 RepID=A0ABW1PN46_9FLAO
MKKYKIHLWSLVLVLGLSSCDDYIDINDSPNNPIAEAVAPELSLPGALTQPFREFAVRPNTLGNLFMNNWGGNVNAFTGIYVTEFNLDINNTFYARIWENFYMSTLTYQDIIDYPSADYDNHKAISKIMKSFYFQYLVDLYGDIPYSEAHDVTNPTPKYDDDQAIYRDLVIQLEDAVALIQNAPANTKAVGGEDVIFQGDMDNWIKLANTIKMRLLIRESDLGASSSYVASEFQELVAANAEFITEDVVINPGYSNSSNERQNPFYGTYGFQINETTPRSGRESTVATQFAVEFLNGTTTGVLDTRLSRIYGLADDGTYTGVVQGEIGANSPSDLSQIGPGLIKNSAQDGYIFTAAESYFLQSEAALKNLLPGDAKALFQSGIESSYTLLGLTTAQYNTYIAASNTVNKIGWDGSSNKIEAIMTQKWIALNGINGVESYIEFTRTGFPVVPLAITALKPAKPRRLLYPASEYVANTANVPNQTQDDAFTTSPFWGN